MENKKKKTYEFPLGNQKYDILFPDSKKTKLRLHLEFLFVSQVSIVILQEKCWETKAYIFLIFSHKNTAGLLGGMDIYCLLNRESEP